MRKSQQQYLKTIECFNCGGKVYFSIECSAPRKNDNENSNIMVSKADFKNLFQYSLKDMLCPMQLVTVK
jgi:hypothetical protein